MDDVKFLGKVEQMGLFAYTVDQAVNMLDISPEDEVKFRKDWADPESAIYGAYRKGVDKRTWQFDSTLFASAKKGNLQAMAELERRIGERTA